jgi:hypothetical protein
MGYNNQGDQYRQQVTKILRRMQKGNPKVMSVLQALSKQPV